MTVAPARLRYLVSLTKLQITNKMGTLDGLLT
jgi:hypothetical protein